MIHRISGYRQRLGYEEGTWNGLVPGAAPACWFTKVFGSSPKNI